MCNRGNDCVLSDMYSGHPYLGRFRQKLSIPSYISSTSLSLTTDLLRAGLICAL